MTSEALIESPLKLEDVVTAPDKIVGILGMGEIGTAIARFYPKHFVRDINRNEFEGQSLDFLHICIPGNLPNFVDIVLENIATYAKGAIVIIHSTVPVGTTKKIFEQHKFTVHSPCRGVHPNLYEGLQTFVKYIGADDSGIGRLVAEHFISIGITPTVVYKSKSTELLKLLDTTYYGVAIAYHAYAQKLCEREDLNFEVVMTDANNTYNDGYWALGKQNVIRPMLTPPADGVIGGHCVVPNAKLLKEQFGDDPLLDSILRHEKKD